MEDDYTVVDIPSVNRPDAETCRRCDGANPSWSAPSPLWNAVMRGGSINGDPLFRDLVCVRCFIHLAETAGVASEWRLSARRVNVELETTTPSGRVWDEREWLWREPRNRADRLGLSDPEGRN